jgi:hypothetical protein
MRNIHLRCTQDFQVSLYIIVLLIFKIFISKKYIIFNWKHKSNYVMYFLMLLYAFCRVVKSDENISMQWSLSKQPPVTSFRVQNRQVFGLYSRDKTEQVPSSPRQLKCGLGPWKFSDNTRAGYLYFGYFMSKVRRVFVGLLKLLF